MRQADFVGGFAKGLRVIQAFSETQQRLSITEASRLTGLDRATVRRSLLTLTELGFADYDGKFFVLTPRVLRLSHAYLAATPLPAMVQPHLDRLSQRAGQSASASVLDGTEIVYVARASQSRIISINLTPGSRLPAYCASMGRVLLAALPDEDARKVFAASILSAKTPKTKTDPAELMAELARVRAEGFALVDQELELGLCSIAVPIENTRGKVAAAINIGASAAHIPALELKERFLPLLLEAQDALRRILP